MARRAYSVGHETDFISGMKMRGAAGFPADPLEAVAGHSAPTGGRRIFTPPIKKARSLAAP